MMRNLRRPVGYAITLIILFFLARTLYTSWSQIIESGFTFTFNAPPLALSFVLLIVARIFAVEAWRRILIALGSQLSFAFALRVWFLSNLARYVPGNVWQVAALMTMVEQQGVSKTNALLSQTIYTSIALSISGMFGLAFAFTRPEILDAISRQFQLQITNYIFLLVAVAFLALITFFTLPFSYRFILALTARVMRRELVAPELTIAHGIVPPLFSTAMWFTNGIAFYLFVSSVTATTLDQLFLFIAINAGAYFIGYVSFVTPSGLGFREAALALMLTIFYPTPIAVALSLVARVWSTIGELLGVVTIWGVPARAAFRREEKVS